MNSQDGVILRSLTENDHEEIARRQNGDDMRILADLFHNDPFFKTLKF